MKGTDWQKNQKGMEKSIKITLSDGREYNLNGRDELSKIDPDKEAIFLFNNGQIFAGLTNGEVDEDDDFMLKRPQMLAIGLPFDRLVGWAYKAKGGES